VNWNCRTHFIEIEASVTVELDRSDSLWSVLSTNHWSKQEDNQEHNAFHYASTSFSVEDQHGYLSLVFAVRVTMNVRQVTLFKLNCN